MPALILVTLLLALFIFLAWFNSLPGERPTAVARTSDDVPSWLGDLSIDTAWSSDDAPSEQHATSDHDCEVADSTDPSHVTEFHVEAEDSCSSDDGWWDSDDRCSSDD